MLRKVLCMPVFKQSSFPRDVQKHLAFPPQLRRSRFRSATNCAGAVGDIHSGTISDDVDFCPTRFFIPSFGPQVQHVSNLTVDGSDGEFRTVSQKYFLQCGMICAVTGSRLAVKSLSANQ
ncbi:hypothetical protein BLNAU_21593 [Blattamonas nauphoetae]|uniref:Uncharacterized protein n=1 Tax=Blattamonas nauphoetae TaxID=2049346 RepID=A0ABQ9WVG3_9EUKA|nr:hypothetical protein BLNAU_21593 [Blattamonas nauphoetae]